MKVTCPKNPEHKKFIVTAHVTEDWVVDEQGNFLEKADTAGEVTHEPDAQDLYICAACFTEAQAART